ncbi:MAG: hypothetical protein S4CHLAM2_00150 [Chlamydiales bacterium]|nr:hypothetical protein [Chlamydiales bacterium]
MSSAQPPGDSFEVKRVGGAQRALKVSCAVFNKKAKRWESPQLDETQQAMVKQALEALRGNAEVTKALNDGATLEITKSGIYLKRGQRWTNLLNDATFSKQRGAVKKTLAAVTGIVGDLSKTAERVVAEPALKAKDGLVIEVNAKRQLRPKALSKEIQDVLDRAEELRLEGKNQEAAEYYAAHMPACYERYCQELVEKRESGEEVDLEHPDDLYAYSNELFSMGLKGSDTGALATAMDRIEAAHNAYQKEARHVETCQKRVEALTDQENRFSQEVLGAIEAFRDPDFVAWLEAEGFTTAEIRAHRECLDALEEISDEVCEALVEVEKLFDAGKTREGKALYEEKMSQLMPVYHAALAAVVIPQRVADNRVSGLRPFALNLDRVQLHQAFATELKQEASVVMDFGLESELSFEPLSDQLNTLIRNATTTMEARAVLMENREAFFACMRREGYSDLETAALLSFLPALQEAGEAWAAATQKAVDLANRKQYADAEAKRDEANQEYQAKLDVILARARPFEKRLQDLRVRKALTTFAAAMGLANPEQFHRAFLLPEQGKPLPNRLTDAQHQFSGFFVHNRIMQHPVLGAEWKKILKEKNLDQDTILRIDEIYSRLALLIQPLQEAELAVESERDPRVKRELRTQLDRLAQKQQKEIRQLKQELDRLGGRKRVQTIRAAANTLRNVIADKTLSKVPDNPERLEMEALGQAMKVAAEDTTALLDERLGFLDELYARRHFYVPYEQNTILRAYPKAERDLKALNSWLNAFHREAQPILLAQARLAEDPENALLQEQFHQTYEHHIDQVNKLNAQFNKKFKHLKLLEVQKNSRVKFGTQILEINKKLVEAARLKNQPQSWDSHFLDALTSTRSPLARALPRFWAPHKLKKEDVKAIQALFKAYNKELRKMHELERRLEAQPGNSRLRAQLRNELDARRKRLQQLDKKYASLEPKIQALEQVVREVEATSQNLAIRLPQLNRVIDSMGDQPVDPVFVIQLLEQMPPAERTRLEREMPTFMRKLNSAALPNSAPITVSALQKSLRVFLAGERGQYKAECKELIEALGDQPLKPEFVKRQLEQIPETERVMESFMYKLNMAATRPVGQNRLQKVLRGTLAEEEKKLAVPREERGALVRQCHGFSVQRAFKDRRAFIHEVYNRQGLS